MRSKTDKACAVAGLHAEEKFISLRSFEGGGTIKQGADRAGLGVAYGNFDADGGIAFRKQLVNGLQRRLFHQSYQGGGCKYFHQPRSISGSCIRGFNRFLQTVLNAGRKRNVYVSHYDWFLWMERAGKDNKPESITEQWLLQFLAAPHEFLRPDFENIQGKVFFN